MSFSSLASLALQPATLGRVTRVVTAVVTQSFEEDKSRVTQAEVRRRAFICIDLFKQLRGDCGYSVTRCLDLLPQGLRARLDGGPWEPGKRSAWSVNASGESAAEWAGEPEETAGADREGALWTPERARLGIVD